MSTDKPEVLWGAKAYCEVIKELTGEDLNPRVVYYRAQRGIYPVRKLGQAISTTRTELTARLLGTDGHSQ